MKRALALLSLALASCPREEAPGRAPARAPDPPGARAAESGSPEVRPAPVARRERLVMTASGDVNLGRAVGQRILKEPAFDPFEGIRSTLAGADLSFTNLESPLSEQNGETEDRERLAFVGPMAGADLLARAGFDVVSVANNHVWDYGRRGFLDTLAALERAGVAYAGASRAPGEQYRPAVLTAKGWSVALFAVTHLWNPGDFARHEAREHVAWADPERLAALLREARNRYDLVLVSYHGGREYSEVPAQEPLDFARAVMAAGADAVFAHHPHVPQGVGWFEGRPIFYSLGNLVFGRHRDHAWTARGFIARVTFAEDKRIEAAACPYVIEGALPKRGVRPDPAEADFRRYLRRSSAFASVGGTTVGALDPDGCLPLEPAPGPRPGEAAKPTQ